MAKVAAYTLGCKVNQYETDALLTIFRQAGYETVEFGQRADVYVINTCTVTNEGERKSRQIIRRATAKNPDAIVVVVGCFAQVAPEKALAIPGVDLVLGTRDRARIIDLIERVKKERHPLSAVVDVMRADTFEELPMEGAHGRTRAHLKIQEGCSNFCSYCIIPYARGPVRSRPVESVVAEAKRLAEAGYKEIVLTGIHLGGYGSDLKPPSDLADIMEHLIVVPEIMRIRIGSVEITELTPRLIEILATSQKACRHLHIPLQSGDDEILKRMNRKYTTVDFLATLTELRSRIPDLAVTTDLIVGFPGETEEHFANALAFVEKARFARMHIFPYSPRAGTAAAKYPGQVSRAEKEERSHRMMELANRMAREFQQGFAGRTMEVLFEQEAKESPGMMEGLTDNYIRVIAKAGEEVKGKILPVRLTQVGKDGMLGEIVNPD